MATQSYLAPRFPQHRGCHVRLNMLPTTRKLAQGLQAPSRRLDHVLRAVLRDRVAREPTVASDAVEVHGKRWRSSPRGGWRVGDKFVLMPDARELGELCQRYGVAWETASTRGTKLISPGELDPLCSSWILETIEALIRVYVYGPGGDIGADFCGRTGEFVRIARGDPVAMVTFDTASNPQSRPNVLLIPLSAAGRFVDDANGQTEDGGGSTVVGAHGGYDTNEDGATLDQMAAHGALEQDVLPVAVVQDAMLPKQSSVLFCPDDDQILMIGRCMNSDSQSFGIIGCDPSTGA